jgi:hypothetical protein
MSHVTLCAQARMHARLREMNVIFAHRWMSSTGIDVLRSDFFHELFEAHTERRSLSECSDSRTVIELIVESAARHLDTYFAQWCEDGVGFYLAAQGGERRPRCLFQIVQDYWRPAQERYVRDGTIEPKPCDCALATHSFELGKKMGLQAEVVRFDPGSVVSLALSTGG